MSRGTLTGRDKTTDCLILGNIAQVMRLAQKLKKQPFGLSRLGRDVKRVLENFQRKSVTLDLEGRKVRLGSRTLVMGIINATPDSFSGDGISGMDPDAALVFARRMVKNGADILDIGGESSRPGSKRVTVREELKRVMPLLSRLAKNVRVPLSIDTTKSEVAAAALDAGAAIVNDISALRFDKKMAKLVARRKACLVLMHMKGEPRTMQKNPRYPDVMDEVFSFLSEAMERAMDAGIARDKIILDPGIGFGKNLEHNFLILERLSALKCLDRPILAGLSRKWFIGQVLKAGASERIWGTAAALSLAIAGGADIVRVHDVKEMKQVASMADAMIRRGAN